MFLGSFDHVLDEKGRTSLPKDFRPIIASADPPPFLTAKPDCLAIYLEDEFNRLREAYAELNIAARERLERLHLGNAQRLKADKQGRILIPPALRRLAHLDREIVFLGVGDRIEIWDRVRQAKEQESTAANYAELTDNLRDRAR